MIRFKFSRLASALALSAAAAFVPAAHAHVSLEWQAALAGSTYKAVFRISHGCGASPTRQVIVDIPAGVRAARPMPRPGWTLAIDRAPLATPYTSHGKTVREDVARVTWTANSPQDMLDAAHFGEFVLLAGLPQAEGSLYWPVHQVCPQGRLDWVQVPASGQQPSELESPAVLLEILPASPGAGHRH